MFFIHSPRVRAFFSPGNESNETKSPPPPSNLNMANANGTKGSEKGAVGNQVVTREDLIRDLLRDDNFLQQIKQHIENVRRNQRGNTTVQNVVDLFNYQSEIPTFSGDSVGPTFEEWWNRFDANSKCAQWTQQRKLQVFPAKLLSTAFDFYRQLERTEPHTILDIDTLKDKFEEKFKDPTTRETYLTRFHAAYKLPAESIKDFA
jgi:hypothetical protein